MGTVVDASGKRPAVILFDQANLDALQALGLARGAGKLAVKAPVLPAVGLHVHAIHHVVVLGQLVRKPDLDTLQALGFAHGTSLGAIGNLLLPAVGLAMHLVHHVAAQVAAVYLYLNGLQTLGLALGASHCPVRAPVLPAVGLHVGRIRNTRSLRQGTAWQECAGGQQSHDCGDHRAKGTGTYGLLHGDTFQSVVG